MNIPIGSTSVIDWIFIEDSSSTAGEGLTGLTSASSGIAGRYLYPGGTAVTLTFETISTLGTYQAPTSNAHLRIKELDGTNLPGWYEVHYHNDWFSVANNRMFAAYKIGGVADMVQLNHKIFVDPALQPATKGRTLGVESNGKVTGVLLTDTLTTYTGNTPQTGDSYAIVNSGTHGNAALKTLIDTIDNFIDTEVAAILAAVDTEVAAIKAKTDNLPTDPADASDIAASFASLTTLINTIDDFLDTEIAAILADTNELQTDWVNGGRLDLLIDAIKAKTDNLPTDPADESALQAAIASLASSLTTIAGYLDTEIAAILADTNELQTDLTNGGRLDLLIDAIKAKTDNLPTDPADESSIQGSIATLQTYVDTEIGAIKTVTDKLDDTLEDDAGTYRFTTNALEQAPSGGGGGGDATEANQIEILSRIGTPSNLGGGASLSANLADIEALADNLPTIETLINAIKLKTDNLPGDPADASDIAASFASIASTLGTIAGYLDTEIAAILADTNEIQTDWVNGGRLDLLIDAIKAKTDGLPSDPADESSIQGTLTTIIGTLATLAAYVDTEVAAIKAKTDNLPTDPADASDIAAAFSTVNATLATLTGYIDTEVAAIKAKTDNLPTDPADESQIQAAIAGIAASLVTLAAYVDTEVAAILATVDTEIAAIKSKTDNLPAAPAAVGSPMTLDLTQILDMDPDTDSVGEALIAALGDGKRKWTVIDGSPPRLVIYRANGTTEWFSFELDDAEDPTTRIPEAA